MAAFAAVPCGNGATSIVRSDDCCVENRIGIEPVTLGIWKAFAVVATVTAGKKGPDPMIMNAAARARPVTVQLRHVMLGDTDSISGTLSIEIGRRGVRIWRLMIGT